MKYKAAIFDLDGTILDSMDSWDNVGKTFLENQNISPPNDLNKIIKEMSFNESAKYFRDSLEVNLSVDEIIASVNKIVEDKYLYEIKLKPYLYEYIYRLKSKNIKLCIATELDKTLSKAALERLGLLACFEFIITSKDVGVGKSSPHIYKKAKEKLNFKKEDILVFEDSLHAIRTAKTEGFNVVGVYDKSSRKDLEEIKRLSDYFINSFKEMEELF